MITCAYTVLGNVRLYKSIMITHNVTPSMTPPGCTIKYLRPLFCTGQTVHCISLTTISFYKHIVIVT